jgi:hypothetical protein
MRLWTVHPKYLDQPGLCAAWREALLAQAVLAGKTKGYRNHPQLERFRAHRDPELAIASYLRGIYAESLARGYHFDGSKIGDGDSRVRLTETDGQLLWEWGHLKAKLGRRAPEHLKKLAATKTPEPHPMFRIAKGPIASWERGVGTRG